MTRKKAPKSTPTPLNKVEGAGTLSFAPSGALVPKRRKFGMVDMTAPASEEEEVALVKREYGGLLGTSKPRAYQLAFRDDPHNHHSEYSGLYRYKVHGLPDSMLKRIPTQDSLVGSIVTARQSQVEAFGVPRPDRFHTGFYFDWIDKSWFHQLDAQQKKGLQERVSRATNLLSTCGSTEGWTLAERCSLGQFLKETARSALTVGRSATEIVMRCSECGARPGCCELQTDAFGREVNQCPGGKDEFHAFRVVDASTIYPTIKTTARGAAQDVRARSEALLRDLLGIQDLVVPEDEWDQYEYVQVVEGRPEQVFTDSQLRTHNFYPVPDMEWNGFPVTPCDYTVTEILTHMSIGRHNQQYFQNGRASRGMIVITSDEVDQDLLMQVRQQFVAGVNGTANAFRMPIFGISQPDTLQWVPIDNSSRDMEYQYLSDSNVRAILSAYQMSPEELPGYAHLSRGTNSQSLSEGNREYILEAHRDLGIRPLLTNLEAVINDLFPHIDPVLAKVCRVRLGGLEAQTKDQEDADHERLLALDGTMNEVLELREKETIPGHLASNIPLNPGWNALLQSYMPVGRILEDLMDVPNASKEEKFAYIRDPFYWQNLENATSQLQMVLQPPMTPLAQFVLPGILMTMFPLLDRALAIEATKAILAQVQVMQEQAMQAQAQAQQQGQNGQEGEEVAKSEGGRRRLLGKGRRIVDSALHEFGARLTCASKELKPVT